MNSQELLPLISRRKGLSLLGAFSLLGATPLVGCATSSPPTSSPKTTGYNIQDPVDQLQLLEKLQGDLSGRQVFSLSKGRVFGIRPDLPDDLEGFGKEVLRFTGCSMRIKRLLPNGNVETKSRSWLLYQHPEHG